MFMSTAQLANIIKERKRQESGFYDKEPIGGYYTEKEQTEWEAWAEENFR